MIIDSLEFAILAQNLASLCPLPLMVTSFNVKSNPEDGISKTVGTKLQSLFDLQNVHEVSYLKKVCIYISRALSLGGTTFQDYEIRLVLAQLEGGEGDKANLRKKNRCGQQSPLDRKQDSLLLRIRRPQPGTCRELPQHGHTSGDFHNHSFCLAYVLGLHGDPQKDRFTCFPHSPRHTSAYFGKGSVLAVGMKSRILRWNHLEWSIWVLTLRETSRGEKQKKVKACANRLTGEIWLTRSADSTLKLQGAMVDAFLEPSVYIALLKTLFQASALPNHKKVHYPCCKPNLCSFAMAAPGNTYMKMLWHRWLCPQGFYKVDSHCNLFLRTLGVGTQMLMLPYPHGNLDTMQSLDLSKDAKPRNGESMTQVYLWLIPKPVLLTRMPEAQGKGQLIAC